ncbi:MAG: fasciclin domain-containing protein [Deltaproteobacteria bacterium]|nr:fasciclin domain-containing protein [Deltaproteobacteria bacterium]
MKDIVETVLADDSFRTLSEALESAGLLETLKGPGPFTFFAPDDEAFKKLNLEEILSDRKKLVETLTYHVVERKMSGEEMRELDCSPTLNGKTLAIKVKHGELVVDNGRVMKTDIECSNGVIHVIDSVFLPHLSGWYGDCGCC